eukprot:CAMPEP_0178922866 /NCGR_PEP_ID=MMETSP0786-20121207/16398_1 /TAXON_ID=186022 /ORGANISM="Thalassionema frauenfeldii, Strain CCMP 1798" /LENGTH=204 /DNA_ID=CAMNT_0020597291 /DNA_START=9 /DNA_END=623 /DNA_ORIENTATION=+
MKLAFTLFSATLSFALSADIIDVGEENGFVTLLAGIEAAGLTDFFREPYGPYTLFAPNEEAFENLPDGMLDCLVKPKSKETLTYILKYHAADGNITSSDITDGLSLNMLNGDDVLVTLSGETVYINEVTVLVGDVGASNGVIHVLESVLVPPETDVDAFLESCKKKGKKGKRGKKGKKGKKVKEGKKRRKRGTIGKEKKGKKRH